MWRFDVSRRTDFTSGVSLCGRDGRQAGTVQPSPNRVQDRLWWERAPHQGKPSAALRTSPFATCQKAQVRQGHTPVICCSKLASDLKRESLLYCRRCCLSVRCLGSNLQLSSCSQLLRVACSRSSQAWPLHALFWSIVAHTSPESVVVLRTPKHCRPPVALSLERTEPRGQESIALQLRGPEGPVRSSGAERTVLPSRAR